MRVIITQKTLTGLSNPYFGGILSRDSFADMNMYRLKWVVFVGPEIYEVTSDFKDLRHRQIPLLVQDE